MEYKTVHSVGENRYVGKCTDVACQSEFRKDCFKMTNGKGCGQDSWHVPKKGISSFYIVLFFLDFVGNICFCAKIFLHKYPFQVTYSFSLVPTGCI